MYSQNREEEAIIDYFVGKVGRFIDIGANDGKTFSNTYEMAQRGWEGVFVEPSPKAFAKLKENYKDKDGFYFYPFALGDTNGVIKFMDSGTHLGKDDHGLLSTANEADYNKWRASTQFTEIEVKCFRYKTFLNRVKWKEFDLICIDAEGYDLNILSQIDLRHTQCVCVEWNSFPGRKREFESLMAGFKIIYTSPENLIFAR